MATSLLLLVYYLLQMVEVVHLILAHMIVHCTKNRIRIVPVELSNLTSRILIVKILYHVQRLSINVV